MFEIGDKYYFEDLGLRNCHLGFNLQRDIHKLIENAVYLHLLHCRFEVFTGQQSGGREQPLGYPQQLSQICGQSR